MKYCSVFGCNTTNKTKDKVLHHLKKEWINLIEWKLHEYTYVYNLIMFIDLLCLHNVSICTCVIKLKFYILPSPVFRVTSI